MKSKKSAVEIEMDEMVLLSNDIIDDSYITTKDARKITDLLEKGSMKIQELRISRDNHATKVQELRKQRDGRLTDEKIIQFAIKSFKMGQEKSEAIGMPIKLWVVSELEELRAKCNKKKK